MTSNAQTTEETPKSSSSIASTSLESVENDSLITPRKRRENVREKGARLLTSGRLRVIRVAPFSEDVTLPLIVAQCRGDSGGVYDLGYDPIRKQWRCTCEARTACSHLHALWSVTAVER